MLLLQYGPPLSFASLFHLTPPSSSLVWPSTEPSPFVHMSILSAHSSFLALKHTASWRPSKESLSQLYKAFIWPVLYMPPRSGSPSSVIHWKKFGSVSQKCLQSNLWLFHFHFYPAAALGIAHPSIGNHVKSPNTCLLWKGSSPPCE